MVYISFIRELSQGICWRLREKIIMDLPFTHKKKPSFKRAGGAAYISDKADFSC